jgi:kinesin family protein 15
MDIQPCKVDVAIQTDPEEYETRDNPLALIPSCLLEASATESRDPSACRDLQLVPADETVPSDDQKQRHFLKVSLTKRGLAHEFVDQLSWV